MPYTTTFAKLYINFIGKIRHLEKNGDHLGILHGHTVFWKKYPLRHICANFGACITI
jgi:hypothetical protein